MQPDTDPPRDEGAAPEVLVLAAHPQMEQSRINRAMLQAAAGAAAASNGRIELRENYQPHRHDGYLDRLDRLEDEAYSRSIPLAFSDLLYTLRQHIDLVRDRLRQLDQCGWRDNSESKE